MYRTTTAPTSVLHYDVDKDLFTPLWYSTSTLPIIPRKKKSKTRVKQFIWLLLLLLLYRCFDHITTWFCIFAGWRCWWVVLQVDELAAEVCQSRSHSRRLQRVQHHDHGRRGANHHRLSTGTLKLVSTGWDLVLLVKMESDVYIWNWHCLSTPQSYYNNIEGVCSIFAEVNLVATYSQCHLAKIICISSQVNSRCNFKTIDVTCIK